MPTAAKRPCNKHPSTLLGRGDKCPICTKDKDKGRQSAHKRGYGVMWRKARAVYLFDNPLCVHCEQEDKITAASVVDHRIPHKGDNRLFWDRSNWQGLCKRCHDIKTATDDGGFGREIKNG